MATDARWLDAPYHLDAQGRSGRTDDDGRVRDLIRAVLFTEPGERVNRPDFGCALRTLVFRPNSDVLAGAIRVLVHSSLQRWLAAEITVVDVAVHATDSTLEVAVVYSRRDTGETRGEVFTQHAGTGAGAGA